MNKKIDIRQANLEDVDSIALVAGRYSKELGWVRKNELKEAIKKKELLVESNSFSYCLYHVKKNGWTVIYSICVPEEERGKGIAQKFINLLQRPIMLKCPEGNESNKFYKHLGFTLQKIEVKPSPRRNLNIWILQEKKENEIWISKH